MGTATARKLPSPRPATTPQEIGARLFSIAGKLERKIAKGRKLSTADVGYIAKKLRNYGERLQAPRTPRPHYTHECSLGTWKILPIRETGFMLVIDDKPLDEYATAEAAAYDVLKKKTGHKAWDATKEKAPAGLEHWNRVGEEPGLFLVT